MMIWLILFGLLLNQTFDFPREWGDIEVFGVAEQREAPVLIAGDTWLIGVWMSADENDTYHTLRRWDGQGMGETKRLSILTAFPQNHQIVSANRGHHHLLWLDGEPNEPAAGLRLWGVIVDQSPDATRGAFIINDYLVGDFDVVADGQGGAWVFFNSLPLSEPNLYIQYLDPAGRPRPPEHILSGGNHPRAVRLDDGTVRLFWHNPLTDQLMSGLFVDNQLSDVQPLLIAPTVGKTDVIEDVQIITHHDTFYIFWTIRRLIDGQIETFFASTQHDDVTDWTMPDRLMIDGAGVGWASPVNGVWTGEQLAVAGVIDNEIGIILMQDGAVIDYQNVIDLGESRLVGGLYLASTSDGRLALSWSQLSPTGAIMSAIRQEK